MELRDNLGKTIPDFQTYEVFDQKGAPPDFVGQNWAGPPLAPNLGEGIWMTNGDGRWNDFYRVTGGPGDIPMPAGPGDANYAQVKAVKVEHYRQRYFAGDKLGMTKDTLVRSHKMQLYRGYGRQE